ncbi:GDP-mannose 4,6 dehydratase 1 [Arthrobacter sp. Hiyo4]|nr:GDP-mannose 4,6 dehydratase 1 [Arthrobacter sp. Hiyo4]
MSNLPSSANVRTAFITGATGQDGSYLADQLAGQGWSVHALVRTAPAKGTVVGDRAFSLHLGDLSDHNNLKRVLQTIQPDVVFNLAGSSSVAESWEDPAATISVNATSVAALMESTWKLQQDAGKEIRFVQASSAEIFGSSTDVPQNELSRICPVSPYGASKALAHHLVGVYRRRGMFVSSAILYNHESPRRPAKFVTRKITSQVARIALGHLETLDLGNLDATRDWGWAPDYVDSLVRMATYKDPDDFVIATGISHTVRDFVRRAFESAGISHWEKHVRVDPRFIRPIDASEMRGDASKAQRLLDWKPTVDFGEMVSQMVQNDLVVEAKRLETPHTSSRGGK